MPNNRKYEPRPHRDKAIDELVDLLGRNNQQHQREASAELAGREAERRQDETQATMRSASAAESTAAATRTYVRHARNTFVAIAISVLGTVGLVGVAIWANDLAGKQLDEVREQRQIAAAALEDANTAKEELEELERRLAQLGDSLAKIAYLNAHPVKEGPFDASESRHEIARITEEIVELIYPDDSDREAFLAGVEQLRREGRERRGLGTESDNR